MTLFIEKLAKRGLFLMALSALSGLALITIYIVAEGVPLIAKAGVFNFVFGTKWAPTQGFFGILPMILGSLWVTVGAIVLGVPVALCCAIFMAEFAPATMKRAQAGHPHAGGNPFRSLWLLGPRLRRPGYPQLRGRPGPEHTRRFDHAGHHDPAHHHQHFRGLPAGRAAPVQGGGARPRVDSMAGDKGWLLPAASSGIVAAVILGVGRAVGETMAVIMVLGNAVSVPTSILDPARTLTTNIGIEMGYASGDHSRALFATGVVLLVIIMILNSVAQMVLRRR